MIRTADVVIIGGGISGCSSAYQLAKRGVKNIVVVERGFVCRGSTGACGAGVRMQWGTEMNCRLAQYSIDFYERANELLEYEGDVEFKQKGYLLISDDERELEQFKKNIAVQRALGIDSRIITLEEAKSLVPHLNAEILKGAAYCEKDGFLNPFLTTDAFYRAARRMGVAFLTHTEVTGIRLQNSRVAAVETSAGPIFTRVAVNAAGGYARRICDMAGVEFPSYSERHQILVTEPVEPMQNPMVMSFGMNLYAQQSPHGSFIMGRSDESEPRDLRVTSSWRFLEEMAVTIRRVLPPVAKLRVIRQWAGLYNITPDRQPVYDEAQEAAGFFIAAGFSGHGFMFGPVTGMAVADMVLNQHCGLDVSRLGLKRFESGGLVYEPSVV